jgi:hypothetical protein
MAKYHSKEFFILAQWIHNGDESNMYLLELDGIGSIKNFLKVASLFKSPDEKIICNSKIIADKLNRITVKWIADIDKISTVSKDSIIELIDLNNFKVVKSDTIKVK